MPPLRRIFHVVLLTMLAAGAVFVLSACGGGNSSGNASQLLKSTFSGSHSINSGNLGFSLTITPSGSSTLKGPITLSFGGPFQSLGKGKLPASNFNVSVSAMGHRGSLAILSTGTSGYITLQGNSYQLPAATFQKLESSFAQVSASGAGSSSSGALSKLGINPLHWLVHPSIVGKETMGGVDTTHIRAGINVANLLNDLNTFLRRASSVGISGTSGLTGGLSSSTRARIAGSVQNPTFDVWTGTSDKTLRRMTLSLTVPVTGQISTLLGGLSSAQIGFDMKYGNLNQPQTITPPTSVRPFSEFQAKLRSFLTAVQSAAALAGSGSAGSGTTGSTGTTTPGASTGSAGATGTTGSGSAVQSYSACLQAAGSDVTKMQQCASLLNGK